MVIQESIRIASVADIDDCLQTLTAAFADDPVCRWAWPARDIYAAAFPEFCRAFGGAAFSAGTAHVSPDLEGVALWLAPGSTPDEQAVMALIDETAEAHLREPLFSIFEQMDAFHPREPHWHLPLIGVDPHSQGRGVGSALLRHALEECDRTGVPAYLEATSAGNARLYERHGFKAIGRIQAGDSPVILPMLRR